MLVKCSRIRDYDNSYLKDEGSVYDVLKCVVLYKSTDMEYANTPASHLFTVATITLQVSFPRAHHHTPSFS